MKWFKKKNKDRTQEKRTTLNDFFFNILTDQTEVITEENAMKTATVYSCVKIIANHVAMLPCQLYFKDKNGNRKRDAKHRVADLIENRPNPYMTPFEFKQTMETHRQLYGNAYAEIEFGKNGYPKGLWILNPKQTKVVTDKKKKVWIVTTLPNGEQRKLKYEKCVHLKNISTSGLVGISPIEVAKNMVLVQNSSQTYLKSFYSNGNLVRGILKVPTQLNKEAKTKVREEWEMFSTGLTNAHRIAVLDAGLEYQQLGLSQADAQFIETQKFSINEIAKIFSVPPHMIGELDRATFSNIEHQAIEFLRDTLTPLLISWEQTLTNQLLSETDIEKNGYYFKFNLNSILRGDSSARANYYEKMIQLGVYSINEVRELEEKNPIKYGDKHFMSLNYVSLENMDEYQNSKKGETDGEKI